MTKRDDTMTDIASKLPRLIATFAMIVRDSHVPEETWKSIDRELTQKLLRGAAGGSRPIGTNRYQPLPKRHTKS